jgi:hypothetical protein
LKEQDLGTGAFYWNERTSSSLKGIYMARGAGQQMAQSGYNTQQQYNTNLENQQSQQGNFLQSQYQQMLANPGYTPAQQAAITTNSTGAAGAAFSGAADSAARTAARTGNSASLAPQQDALAQQKAQTMSQVNAANQTSFANDAQKQQEQALQGLSGVFGQDTSLLAKSLGLPPEYLKAFNGAKPGFWQNFGDQTAGGAIGGGLQALAAGL